MEILLPFSVPFILILILEVFQVCNDLLSVPMLHPQNSSQEFPPWGKKGQRTGGHMMVPGSLDFLSHYSFTVLSAPILSAATLHLVDR